MSEDTLARLAATIASRRSANASASYTKSLLDKGIAACAKKLGEEATETVIAALSESDDGLCAKPPILSIICLWCLRRATFRFSPC